MFYIFFSRIFIFKFPFFSFWDRFLEFGLYFIQKESLIQARGFF